MEEIIELECKILDGDFDEYTLDRYNSEIRNDQCNIDIVKACEFLRKYAVQYTEPIGGDIDTVQMCEDLRKYVLEGVEPIFNLEDK